MQSSGAEDGRPYSEHCDEWLRHEHVDLGLDLGVDNGVVTRTIIWIPSPFAVLISRGHWNAWVACSIMGPCTLHFAVWLDVLRTSAMVVDCDHIVTKSYDVTCWRYR